MGSGHPDGEPPTPAVVRRFEEYGLPELVAAAVAGDADVSHAAAARRLPGPVRTRTASGSPAPCRATAHDRMGRIRACSRTGRRRHAATQVLLRAAPVAGVAAGPDVGLDVDRQLGYLLGGTAALVMALTRSRAGKLDDDVLTGHPGVATSVWKNAARASIIAMPFFERV
jgi:hypothetical protein